MFFAVFIFQNFNFVIRNYLIIKNILRQVTCPTIHKMYFFIWIFINLDDRTIYFNCHKTK